MKEAAESDDENKKRTSRNLKRKKRRARNKLEKDEIIENIDTSDKLAVPARQPEIERKRSRDRGEKTTAAIGDKKGSTVPVSGQDKKGSTVPVSGQDTKGPKVPVSGQDTKGPKMPVSGQDKKGPTVPVSGQDKKGPTVPVSGQDKKGSIAALKGLTRNRDLPGGRIADIGVVSKGKVAVAVNTERKSERKRGGNVGEAGVIIRQDGVRQWRPKGTPKVSEDSALDLANNL